MEVRAVVKDVRQSPRKVKEVVALVRDRTVDDALVILEHTPRRAAEPVAKVIRSAAANATNNNKMTKDSLIINSIAVGPGQVLKRFRAGARGMAKPYKRRSSNITVTLSGEKRTPKAKAKTPSKKGAK